MEQISIYRNYFHSEPAFTCTVSDFCSNVYHGDYREEVEAIRAEPDKKKRDAIKATLPAATISGTFSERKKSGLIDHSGYIAVDRDAGDNPHIQDWEHERDRLIHVKNVFFSALSVSGRGVFLVIPLAYPKKHEKHFDAIRQDLQKLGFVIDKSCRDVSRLRGISYDSEAKINYKAIPYKRVYEPKPLRASRTPYKGYTDDLGQLLDKILRSGVDITSGYLNWRTIGRALVNEYGEGGRAYFHQLSRMYPGYKESEADKQYSAYLRSPGKATKATIFHLAKEHGILLKQ